MTVIDIMAKAMHRNPEAWERASGTLKDEWRNRARDALLAVQVPPLDLENAIIAKHPDDKGQRVVAWMHMIEIILGEDAKARGFERASYYGKPSAPVEMTSVEAPITRANAPNGPVWERDGASWLWEEDLGSQRGYRWAPLNKMALSKTGPTGEMIAMPPGCVRVTT